MLKTKAITLYFFMALSISNYGQSSIYVNDMDYVLGDVKQAFIQDKIATSDQVANLLAGFKAMKVNGIRIPIFPTGTEPNEQALKYFYQQAVAAGFDIFANPAQDSGGRRIANGSLASADQVTVKNDPEKRQILIDRILEIDKEYPMLKWINPFNEDAKTGSIWSASDMNSIYSTLYNNLENAALIGSCAWGIPASIDVFKNTTIKNYITISTTHNLGFNHSSWTQFINLSKAAGLPVWDSEVNNDDKNKDGYTRIVAAIEYGVDGLVLYNSWNFINLETGAINATGETFMNFYLKASALEEANMAKQLATLVAQDKGFNIAFTDQGLRHKVSIYANSGNLVKSYHNVSGAVLQVDNLQKGIYIVAISSNNESQVEKVMAQ